MVAQYVSGVVALVGSAGEGARELVESFLSVPIAETTAALHVLAEYLEDELLVARIRRGLAQRRHPMPDQVSQFAQLEVGRACVMTDPLGDGEDVILELHAPGVPPSSMLIYVDHNLGALLKDAFVADDFDTTIARLTEISHDQGLPATFEEITHADVRARVEEALAAYDRDDHGVPPGETWPAMRAFVGYSVRGLPEGGTGYDDGSDRDALDEEDEAIVLAHDFLDSPEAASLSTPEDQVHEIAHVLMDFTLAFLGTDPLRWSPPTAEIALDQALPTMVDGDWDGYDEVPEVLAALVRFAHRVREIPASLTQETLATVTMFTPSYLSKRHDPEVMERRRALELAFEAINQRSLMSWTDRQLTDAVGSVEVARTMGTAPLPDEGLDLTGVPPDISDRVLAIAQLVDGACARFFDIEVRTACRRFLAMVATNDPPIFRRRSRDDTTAAAIVWVIGRANRIVSTWEGGLPVGDLMDHFGLSGSPSQRAQTMLRAIGVDPHRQYGGMDLATPLLLTSERRAELLRLLGPELQQG